MVMPNSKTRTCLDDLRPQIVHERQIGTPFVYSESLYFLMAKKQHITNLPKCANVFTIWLQGNIVSLEPLSPMNGDRHFLYFSK